MLLVQNKTVDFGQGARAHLCSQRWYGEILSVIVAQEHMVGICGIPTVISEIEAQCLYIFSTTPGDVPLFQRVPLLFQPCSENVW